MTILEGESLVNDATATVCLRSAVAGDSTLSGARIAMAAVAVLVA